MEIIIGRDRQGELQLAASGSGQQTVKNGTVPPSVGQQHCKLEIDNGQMTLTNLDINGYTYVNGRSVEKKIVTQNDTIALGIDLYPLDWTVLQPFLPADIHHLKAVWDNYEREQMELQIAMGRFNSLRSATGLITMVAIALSVFMGGKSIWYIALYGIAIVASLIFFVKAYRDASKMPQRKLELTKKFQRDYACPHCGRFLGNQSFDMLSVSGYCPYCKTKFIH